MTSFSHIIPIDRNGFFCTGRKSLEASTADSEVNPQYETFSQIARTSAKAKFDAIKNAAVVTPEKKIGDPIDDETLHSKAEVKRWARGMLKAEPCSFVTQAGLLLALKHNAPAPVIQFMLKINPNIMNFPKVGPTPLQVAVQHNAELDVVQMLLNASPVGECIRNPDFPESPLEYAKRYHSNRPDLIELLSRKSKTPDPDPEKKQRGRASFPSEFNLFPRYSSLSLQTPTRSSFSLQTPSNSSFSLQTPTKQKTTLLSPPPSFSTRRGRANSIISSSTTSEVTSPTTNPKKNDLSEVKLLLNPPKKNVFPEGKLLSNPPKKNALSEGRLPSNPPKNNVLSEEKLLSNLPMKNILSEVKVLSNQKNSEQPRSTSRSPATIPDKESRAIKSNIDREELNNVKTLCALLWKSQRKMAKQMNASKSEIEIHSELIANMGTKDEILEDLMKQQRSQMFRNWIALDTKERAYQKTLEKMEKNYIKQLEKRLHSWTGSMRLWNESTREQLEELRELVDSEAETNEYFRSNMTDWVEKYTVDQENNSNVPSQVFATNLGEVDQKVPLCVGIRGTFCGYGTDTTDGDTDPIIGVDENENENDSNLIRVKKRSWRPLFKNRDYSAVE